MLLRCAPRCRSIAVVEMEFITGIRLLLRDYNTSVHLRQIQCSFVLTLDLPALNVIADRLRTPSVNLATRGESRT